MSALNFPGNPSRILDLAEAGEIHLAVPDDILSEVNRVLLRPKFGWSQDRLDAAIRQIAGFAEHVEPKQRLDMIFQFLHIFQSPVVPHLVPLGR